VFVLLLVQSGMIALATLGELLFMGGLPFYLVVPAIRITLLLIFGALMLRGSRTGLVGLLVLQAFSIGGFLLTLGAGLLPQVDFTPTLTGLFGSLFLPAIIFIYCIQLLLTRPAPTTPPALPTTASALPATAPAAPGTASAAPVAAAVAGPPGMAPVGAISVESAEMAAATPTGMPPVGAQAMGVVANSVKGGVV
jgi:hypothetical protein